MNPRYAVLLLLLFITGCEPANPVVGSEEVFVLSGSQIVLTSRQLSSNKLIAQGTIKNNGSTTYTPFWYVEGEFYGDTTYAFKLGGTNQSFTYSLGPGESTPWRLEFTSSTIDVNSYPVFGVKNLRAIRDKN